MSGLAASARDRTRLSVPNGCEGPVPSGQHDRALAVINQFKGECERSAGRSELAGALADDPGG